VSLKTREKAEAVQKVNAMNETERQPSISLGLAKVYLTATDPKLATRTWQDVMENIITKKTDETLKRWQTAIKDKNFDCIRNLHVCGAPALLRRERRWVRSIYGGEFNDALVAPPNFPE
jgi:hypothetical protein